MTTKQTPFYTPSMPSSRARSLRSVHVGGIGQAYEMSDKWGSYVHDVCYV